MLHCFQQYTFLSNSFHRSLIIITICRLFCSLCKALQACLFILWNLIFLPSFILEHFLFSFFLYPPLDSFYIPLLMCQPLVLLLRSGEGNGNPLQCSCLENPRDGGAWWAAVYGVAQSRTGLKRLSSSSSSFLYCLLCFLLVFLVKRAKR